MAGEALGYAAARKAVDLYAGGNRDLCWGTMIYACVGVKFPRPGREAKPSCGHQERYWVGVGVEGPPALRAAVVEATKGQTKGQTKQGWEEEWVEEMRRLIDSIGGVSFIPSPFYAGRCPRCGGEMQHVAWRQDEEFPNDLRLAPVHARYFRVPDEAKAQQYVTEGYGGAELVESGKGEITMSERLKEIQKRLSAADPAQPGLDRIDDDFRRAESDLYHHAREDLDYLLAENAALRTRAEEAERERDEAKEVFELALREKGWAKALTDAYTERDALRVDLQEARELLEKAQGYFVDDALDQQIDYFLSRTAPREGGQS